ncbi:hypothetical protein BG015_005111, partial [Linnemannia schmuckeri]
KFAFNWTVEVETATLEDLKLHLYKYDSHYAHDDYLEIYLCNNRHAKAETIINDECLRKPLRVAKTTCRTMLKSGPKFKWTISLATPSKKYSASTFKDVCAEFNITSNLEPSFGGLTPLEGIQVAPMETDLQKEMVDVVIREVGARVRALKLFGANEATKSMVV